VGGRQGVEGERQKGQCRPESATTPGLAFKVVHILPSAFLTSSKSARIRFSLSTWLTRRYLNVVFHVLTYW